MNDDLIAWLQSWCVENCDEDREHQNGVQIRTLDNPGWRVIIDLEDTTLEYMPFATIDMEKAEDNWLVCKVDEKKFKGYCSPLNLLEVIGIFKSWVESNRN